MLPGSVQFLCFLFWSWIFFRFAFEVTKEGKSQQTSYKEARKNGCVIRPPFAAPLGQPTTGFRSNKHFYCRVNLLRRRKGGNESNSFLWLVFFPSSPFVVVVVVVVVVISINVRPSFSSLTWPTPTLLFANNHWLAPASLWSQSFLANIFWIFLFVLTTFSLSAREHVFYFVKSFNRSLSFF